MSAGGSGSSGPKSPLALSKSVDKRGSEVADRSVMTMAGEAPISIREFATYRASGRFLQKEDGTSKKNTRRQMPIMRLHAAGIVSTVRRTGKTSNGYCFLAWWRTGLRAERKTWMRQQRRDGGPRRFFLNL
jgi:hypothetical protein